MALLAGSSQRLVTPEVFNISTLGDQNVSLTLSVVRFQEMQGCLLAIQVTERGTNQVFTLPEASSPALVFSAEQRGC